MSLLNTSIINCPYCSESIEIVVDASVRKQEYVEDCQVCCRPILINIQCNENDEINVQARQEND